MNLGSPTLVELLSGISDWMVELSVRQETLNAQVRWRGDLISLVKTLRALPLRSSLAKLASVHWRWTQPRERLRNASGSSDEKLSSG